LNFGFRDSLIENFKVFRLIFHVFDLYKTKGHVGPCPSNSVCSRDTWSSTQILRINIRSFVRI
jgi:hypothetical protein